jgi:hypothetical protein
VTREEALAIERIVHCGWPHEDPNRDEEAFVRVIVGLQFAAVQWALTRLLQTVKERPSAYAIAAEAAKRPFGPWPRCAVGDLVERERLRLS